MSVLTAGPHLFDGFSRDIEIVPLPNMIGAGVPTPRLYAEPTPQVMHCVPLGLAEMRRTMRTILDHLDDRGVGLFVVDVSAEIALLSRIASVPGGADPHARRPLRHRPCRLLRSLRRHARPLRRAAGAGRLPPAPEGQDLLLRGLCTTLDAVPDKAEARRRLGLDPAREIIVTVTGGGGSGTPYAPLTVAARAAPDALWLTLGPTHREGHETDFSNLRELGWVPGVTDYLAAADIVIASAGDNTIHEVARVGAKLVVMPEWRYFGEQTRKAEALVKLGAAVTAPAWPGDLQGWQQLLAEARALDGETIRTLHARRRPAAPPAGWKG